VDYDYPLHSSSQWVEWSGFQPCGPGMKVSKRVLLAAASSSTNGDKVMAVLLDQKGDQITITDEVVEAVAGNEGSGDTDGASSQSDRRPDHHHG
jgi:hypothetical protein